MSECVSGSAVELVSGLGAPWLYGSVFDWDSGSMCQ